LERRDVIGQAKGILMAQSGMSSEEAFDVLRRASQRSNRKLHVLAEEMVQRHASPEAAE
jgi:AmiR/NasT family two-component response regulator